MTKNRTANHAWRVDLTWSHDGMSLAIPFIALSAEMTADAQSSTPSTPPPPTSVPGSSRSAPATPRLVITFKS